MTASVPSKQGGTRKSPDSRGGSRQRGRVQLPEGVVPAPVAARVADGGALVPETADDSRAAAADGPGSGSGSFVPLLFGSRPSRRGYRGTASFDAGRRSPSTERLSSRSQDEAETVRLHERSCPVRRRGGDDAPAASAADAPSRSTSSEGPAGVLAKEFADHVKKGVSFTANVAGGALRLTELKGALPQAPRVGRDALDLSSAAVRVLENAEFAPKRPHYHLPFGGRGEAEAAAAAVEPQSLRRQALRRWQQQQQQQAQAQAQRLPDGAVPRPAGAVSWLYGTPASSRTTAGGVGCGAGGDAVGGGASGGSGSERFALLSDVRSERSGVPENDGRTRPDAASGPRWGGYFADLAGDALEAAAGDGAAGGGVAGGGAGGPASAGPAGAGPAFGGPAESSDSAFFRRPGGVDSEAALRRRPCAARDAVRRRGRRGRLPEGVSVRRRQRGPVAAAAAAGAAASSPFVPPPAASPLSVFSPQASSERLTLMTFNAGLLEYRMGGFAFYRNPPFTSRRLYQLAPALRAVACDIVALQEVYEEWQAEYLTEALRATLPFSARRTSGGRFALHNGLLTLSRFPIVHTCFHAFSAVTAIERVFASKGMLEATVRVAGVADLMVLNVHLASGAVDPEGRGIESLRNEEIRHALRVCEVAAERGEVPIIIGDLNASPDCCASNYNAIIDAGYTDALVVAAAAGTPAAAAGGPAAAAAEPAAARRTSGTGAVGGDEFHSGSRLRNFGDGWHGRDGDSRDCFGAGGACVGGGAGFATLSLRSRSHHFGGRRGTSALRGFIRLRQALRRRGAARAAAAAGGAGPAAAAGGGVGRWLEKRDFPPGGGSGATGSTTAEWASLTSLLSSVEKGSRLQRKYLLCGGAEGQDGPESGDEAGDTEVELVSVHDSSRRSSYAATAADHQRRPLLTKTPQPPGSLPPARAAPPGAALAGAASAGVAPASFAPTGASFGPAVASFAPEGAAFGQAKSAFGSAAAGAGLHPAAAASGSAGSLFGGPKPRLPSSGTSRVAAAADSSTTAGATSATTPSAAAGVTSSGLSPVGAAGAPRSVAIEVIDPLRAALRSEWLPPAACRGPAAAVQLLNYSLDGTPTLRGLSGFDARGDALCASIFTWDPQNPLNAVGPHAACRGLRCDHVFLPAKAGFRALRGLFVARACVAFTEPRVMVGGCCCGLFGAGQLVTLSDHYAVCVELRTAPKKRGFRREPG